jgi:holliday junction DNA helicase RuvA
LIARLRGRPVGTTADGLILDVNGVGYLVNTTPSAAAKKGDEITIETYLHVREDTLQLFGFADAGERELFVQLLGVNGVGPKVALAIVSGSRPDELRRAIVREDAARFQAIPGIGKKTAERIVLELKEKIDIGENADAFSPRDLTACDALVGLGYAPIDAERALADVDPSLPLEEQVRLALRRAA